MPRMKRVVVPKYPHHVVQRGVRSMDIFYHDDDRREYLHLLSSQSQRFGVSFISYCLMTNHVHLLAIPESPNSLARAIGEAHRLYTRMINFRKKVSGYLFQGRFASCPVETGEYLFGAVRYIERNPVRAKMVLHPWDYSWSSAAAHVGIIERDPLIVTSPLLSEINDWYDFLSIDSDLSSELKQKSCTGRPFGADQFYTTVERITGRDLRLKPSGRPLKNK